MRELELLQKIRPIWLDRGVDSMARGYSLRDQMRGQLEQFYSLLEQVIETGDPAWLDSILLSWVNSLTQSDLGSQDSSMTHLVNELMTLSFRICRETLDDSQAMTLINALVPCYSYAIDRASELEIHAKITYLTNQLESVKQSLEKLDRSKSDFIAVAAHELRTPLTLVQGYTSMLRENVEQKGANPTEKLLLDGIQNGTNRLHSIIGDMIDVSLIDNNLLQLNFQPVWLNRLFSLLEQELKENLVERKLKYEVSDFPGSSEIIFADSERILQVFRNVLSNAIKYTPDNGSIQIDGRKLPGFIEVTITDNGIGIDPDDQSVIFEKFGRLGNTSLHSSGKTKFKGGGPGLGLRIAKGIIESHGGAIWVESDGHDESTCPGSTFHVLLPHRTEPPDERMARIFAPLLHKKF
jgi:signal transduction histidine kinase